MCVCVWGGGRELLPMMLVYQERTGKRGAGWGENTRADEHFGKR